MPRNLTTTQQQRAETMIGLFFEIGQAEMGINEVEVKEAIEQKFEQEVLSETACTDRFELESLREDQKTKDAMSKQLDDDLSEYMAELD